MPQLKKTSLYIASIEQSLDFYQKKLGMTLISNHQENGRESFLLSFDPSSARKEACLELIYDKTHIHHFPKDRDRLEGYWKISIAIKDVDIARKKLIQMGIEVSDGFQVPDVAYLCHLYDPNGYCIELIQHKFSHNHTSEPENPDFVLGNPPVLSLVTYRAKDIDSSLDFYTKVLGMNLLSRMALPQRGFDLYFLGFSPEPEEDVESINIREALWQRPNTMIELQQIHKYSPMTDFSYDVSEETGFIGLTIESEQNQTLSDPDGYQIRTVQKS